MEGIIKVSPETLISTAGEFSNQGSTINTLTGEMMTLVTGLRVFSASNRHLTYRTQEI